MRNNNTFLILVIECAVQQIEVLQESMGCCFVFAGRLVGVE
jgi:hypothetical protein